VVIGADILAKLWLVPALIGAHKPISGRWQANNNTPFVQIM
jgi:hypothetical protein